MKKTHLSGAITLFLLAASLPAAMRAQSTVYFSQPTRIGARALSFAGAVVSDNPDVTAMYVNPAALSFLDNSNIVATHHLQRSANVMEENIAIPLFLRRGEVVGVALSVNHVGYVADNDRNNFEVMQYGYDVSYSRRLDSRTSIGGILNVRYAQSTASKLWGLNSSFGLVYFPARDISYGLSFNGFGYGIKYIDDGTNTQLNTENIPRSIRTGATMRFPVSANKDRILTISTDAEKVFERPGVSYFGGFELFPAKFIVFRLGYFGSTEGPEFGSFGIGYRWNGWRLDFGTTPSRLAGELYQVSFSIPLWNQLDAIY